MESRLFCMTSTCNVVTLRSSSEIYCSFLTLDLCADCRFAKILATTHEIIRFSIIFYGSDMINLGSYVNE